MVAARTRNPYETGIRYSRPRAIEDEWVVSTTVSSMQECELTEHRSLDPEGTWVAPPVPFEARPRPLRRCVQTPPPDRVSPHVRAKVGVSSQHPRPEGTSRMNLRCVPHVSRMTEDDGRRRGERKRAYHRKAIARYTPVSRVRRGSSKCWRCWAESMLKNVSRCRSVEVLVEVRGKERIGALGRQPSLLYAVRLVLGWAGMLG